MDKIINVSNIYKNSIVKKNSQISFEGSIKIPQNFKKHFSKKAEMKMLFKEKLFELYNRNNYYKSEKENIEYVKRITDMVNNPTLTHLNIVSKYDASLSLLHRIFKNIDGSKKRLNFVNKVSEIVVKDNLRPEIMAEILESPLSSKYINNFKKIKSYLIYNKTNGNTVVHLDMLYNKKMFDNKVYDKILLREKHKREFPFAETSILNKAVFGKIYTKQAAKLSNSISSFFQLSKEMLVNGNDKEILNMLKSANSKNINLRLHIIDVFSSKYHNSENTKINENITELNKLFNKLDNDKHAKRFVKKSISQIKYSVTLKELNEMLECISTRKLDIYSPNVINILSKVRGENRFAVLSSEIKNPFFETENSLRKRNLDIEYGYMKKTSKFSILKKRVINSFRILKDNLGSSKKTFEEAKPNVKLNPPVYLNPERLIEYKPKSSKEIVKEDVINLVSKKLAKKTFKKQENAYSANATKMRLSMLAEIFKSVAETRQVDKAVGKVKISSSKKDVLALYLRINSSNKKFINYMLKKRNADGTRMFEIKEIINTIDKAEIKIAEMKKLNSQYRAKDTKKYYNHLYEAKIEQYGKVKLTRSKNFVSNS